MRYADESKLQLICIMLLPIIIYFFIYNFLISKSKIMVKTFDKYFIKLFFKKIILLTLIFFP